MQDRDNERGKGQGPGRFSRFSRTASFWILIVLIPLLIINVFSPRRQDSAELPYMPDFRQQLDAGNVQEVKIIEGQKIEGTLRVPISRDNKTVREFRTHLPIANSEAILNEIQAQVPVVDGAEERQSWWTLVIGILPWLLIFGFWIFMLRQMQVGGSKAFQFG